MFRVVFRKIMPRIEEFRKNHKIGERKKPGFKRPGYVAEKLYEKWLFSDYRKNIFSIR